MGCRNINNINLINSATIRFRQVYGTLAAFFDIRHLYHAFAAEALGDITPLNLEKKCDKGFKRA